MAFCVIPHRGSSADAPENTIASFDLAIAQGFTCFETDCQLSRDGVCMVIHDEDLARTTNGKGTVADIDGADMQLLDAGRWFAAEYAGARVPTLAAVLQRYKSTVHLHLELKSEQEALAATVARELHAAGWDDIADKQNSSDAFAAPGLTITSFHLHQLQRSLQVLPRVRHGWLVQEITPDVLQTAKVHGFDGVYPRANACTPASVQAALQAGFSVRCWGVHTAELLLHVKHCGAQAATVNWPAAAAHILAEC